MAQRDLRLGPGGICEYIMRQTGTFKFAGESNAFRRFPFDKQDLRITVGSFLWSSAQVQFELDDDTRKSAECDFSEVRPAAEWKVVGVSSEVHNEPYTGEPTGFSEMSIIFTLKRQPGFYLFRVCLPLFILVAIAISVLWMPARHAEARMILSVTTLVAVTTFSIVVNANLPRLPYLTLLDQWMLFSFVLSAFGAFENVGVTWAAHHKNEEAAEKVDRWCRWLVSPLYMIGTIVCAAGYRFHFR